MKNLVSSLFSKEKGESMGKIAVFSGIALVALGLGASEAKSG